jgi:hypothetical protein
LSIVDSALNSPLYTISVQDSDEKVNICEYGLAVFLNWPGFQPQMGRAGEVG